MFATKWGSKTCHIFRMSLKSSLGMLRQRYWNKDPANRIVTVFSFCKLAFKTNQTRSFKQSEGVNYYLDLFIKTN